jgi:hypothetical protein
LVGSFSIPYVFQKPTTGRRRPASYVTVGCPENRGKHGRFSLTTLDRFDAKVGSSRSSLAAVLRGCMGGIGTSWVRIVAVASVAVLTVGSGTAIAGAKPAFSKRAADYIPATIDGTKVVLDPRSAVGSTDPSCQIPAGGQVVIPLITGEASVAQEALGGLWDCPIPDQLGTGFVAGIDAAKVVPSTPKLSKRALYAPAEQTDAGSVKVRNVKVNGLRVKVFVWRTTNTTASPAGPAGTVFELASAEPRAHLLVTVTTPAGVKPLRYLTAMLKAGAGKLRRAG